MAQPSRSTAIGQAAPHGATRAHRSFNATVAAFMNPVNTRPVSQPLSAPMAHHEISV